MMHRALALLFAGLCLAGTATAQSVSFNGSLGARAALLLIDGQPRTVALGSTVAGVRLIALQDDLATVELSGKRVELRLGAVPGRIGAAPGTGSAGRQIVLSSGPGGHFTANGSINGHTTQFLVDTGATNVALAQTEAERLGLRFQEGRRIMTQTANGTVPAHMMQLDSVRIGDVEIRNVDATIVPGQMSYVLLGNSFLARFQMKRENDVMTLELRY